VNLTINNTTITVVPLERLTDDELRLYLSMLEKQRAIPIEALTPPATPEGSR